MTTEKDVLEAVTKELMDKGKIIEAGWVAMRVMSIAKTAPPIQLEEMRSAFFAGAQHLYGSIMGALEDGEEPTDNDMRRMEMISKELDEFIADYSKRHGLTPGKRNAN